MGGQTSGAALAKNPGAAFYIPTENEWYKAAYYSPSKGGVSSPGYYSYATQSDSAPGNAVGGAVNQANYRVGGIFSVTQSSEYDGAQSYLTDVGAFINSDSYYGTFDQSGNVYQWNDLDGLATSDSFRGVRGGAWDNLDAVNVSASWGVSNVPSDTFSHGVGFRLAAPVPIPEPSTAAMALAGLACGGYLLRRCPKQA